LKEKGARSARSAEALGFASTVNRSIHAGIVGAPLYAFIEKVNSRASIANYYRRLVSTGTLHIAVTIVRLLHHFKSDNKTLTMHATAKFFFNKIPGFKWQLN